MNVYEKLVEKVGAAVKSYRTDLDHDKNGILANPGIPFIHWTRESGTHLQMLPAASADCFPAEGVKVPYLFGFCDRRELSHKPIELAQYLAKCGEVKHCTWFDGEKLHSISTERAVEIARKWCNRVNAEWNKHN